MRVILLNLQVAYCKMAVEIFLETTFFDPVHAPGGPFYFHAHVSVVTCEAGASHAALSEAHSVCEAHGIKVEGEGEEPVLGPTY